MSVLVDELFEKSIELVQRYGKCVLKDPTSDAKSEFEKLSPVLMDICDARKRYSTVQNVFRGLIDEVEQSEEINADECITKFKTDIEKTVSQLPLGEEDETYLQFKGSFLVESNPPLDDSEIAAVSQTKTTIDPITKLPLTDPVKNIKCGHVYEKASILQLIQQRKNVKCPIAGCVAAEGVDKDDLVPDVALKMFLDSQKRS